MCSQPSSTPAPGQDLGYSPGLAAGGCARLPFEAKRIDFKERKMETKKKKEHEQVFLKAPERRERLQRRATKTI